MRAYFASSIHDPEGGIAHGAADAITCAAGEGGGEILEEIFHLGRGQFDERRKCVKTQTLTKLGALEDCLEGSAKILEGDAPKKPDERTHLLLFSDFGDDLGGAEFSLLERAFKDGKGARGGEAFESTEGHPSYGRIALLERTQKDRFDSLRRAEDARRFERALPYGSITVARQPHEQIERIAILEHHEGVDGTFGKSEREATLETRSNRGGGFGTSGEAELLDGSAHLFGVPRLEPRKWILGGCRRSAYE